MPKMVVLSEDAYRQFPWLPRPTCPAGILSHPGTGEMVKVDLDGKVEQILPGGFGFARVPPHWEKN